MRDDLLIGAGARRRRAAVGSGALAALLVSGLGTVPERAVAQGPLPDGAETHLVSQTDAGESTQAYLTPDGQRVAFTSTADDLVTGDTNGVADVFLSTAQQGSADPFSGPAVLVSRPDAAVGQDLADGPSGQPVASTDGRYVAFSSTATNLVAAGSTPSRQHVYVRDTRAGTTFRVQADTEPNGASYGPDITDDGRHLVFTSEATDLSAGDTNGAPDAYVADLDSNGDGTLGDITLRRFADDGPVAGGTFDPVISGSGEMVAFSAYVPDLHGGVPADPPVSHVFFEQTSQDTGGALLVRAGAREPAIDSSGAVVAYVDEVGCDAPDDILGGEAVGVYNVRYGHHAHVGWRLVDRRVGESHAPALSADGSMIAWQTTQPEWDFATPDQPPLAEPVVRVQEIPWFDAFLEVDPCLGIVGLDWYDVAPGAAPTLSASGRTVAFAGPSAESAAPSAVQAVDRHSHDGLSVSSTVTGVPTLGFVTAVDIGAIPPTQLRDYASALADAPIHRLPIHRLPIHRLPIHRLPIHRLLVDDAPIHRLPIHRLPIHRLPIHRLDIPGGWAELLAATPYAGELLHTVLLGDVLGWAEDTLADPQATEAQRAAALRIQSLNLEDVDLSTSGIDGLSLASLVLGSAPVAEVPIPGTGTATSRWQALLDGQGIALTVGSETVLAELDSAGLDIARTRLEDVPLGDLPVPQTLMDRLLMTSLFLENTPLGEVEVASLDAAAQTALFGAVPPTGSLADHRATLLPGATVADLAVGAPPEVTFGTLLFSLLDAESYPWEQIDVRSIPHEAIAATTEQTCELGGQCESEAMFSFTFDAGPGEATVFSAPLASVKLPAGTTGQSDAVAIWGSGPQTSWFRGDQYPGPVTTDAELVRFPLADTPSGTSFVLGVPYTATLSGPGDSAAEATLTSGTISDTDQLWSSPDLAFYDDPTRNMVAPGVWEKGQPPAPLVASRVYYEWISPLYKDLNDFGEFVLGPAADEDYYVVTPPVPGERLVISTNAADGQIAMALYTPAEAPALGVTDAGAAPGVAVTERSGPAGAGAEVGADAGPPVEGHTLVDQTMARDGGVAEIEAASADVGSDPLLVRVTSGTGQAASSLYSLRVRYVEEPAEQTCAPWTRPPGADGVVGTSDPVTADTNTIYLMDTERFGDTHGAAAAASVRNALTGLTQGTPGTGVTGIQGVVLSVDASPAVRSARGALDANPCSMTGRRDLVGAVNTYVADQLGDLADNIESVVLVGGDDILPFVPVSQRTSQFNEASHAASLRLTEQPGGQPCPPSVATGEVDPCATPLSAAAATNHVLTDDPYGLADAYRSLGGHLYVPTVAVGRLVETPAQIQATVARFSAAQGVLAADSSLTGGYGAWAELPDQVGAQLEWRTAPADRHTLTEPWTKADVEALLYPAAGSAPRVVSVNTHADESRMLPGIAGAEDGRFAEADLLLAGDHPAAEQLAGALVFLIGCHAAQNLPSAYYGDVPDWADVFSASGGFVGNTGFGLANNVTTALSERLLGLYAEWLGATSSAGPVTAGGALTYAKQTYLGELGRYSGYDEKVLMQTVFYGLPMSTVASPTKPLPLPTVPPNLTPVETGPGGLASAGLVLTPTFTTQSGTDAEGREVTYLVADGQEPLVVAGQPVLPKLVHQLPPDPEGRVPRGALLTALSSTRQDVIPAIAEPTVGARDSTSPQLGTAFPSSFATVTRQDTPTGPTDLLVVTPGRVQTGPDGSGFVERFTSLSLDVTYADPVSTDTTSPVFGAVEPVGRTGTFEVDVDGTGSEVVRVLLLVQFDGETAWQAIELTQLASGTWSGTVPGGNYRWILQAADAGGNVATESARGLLTVAEAPAPQLGDTGADVTMLSGGRLQRTVEVEVTDLAPGELLTGRYTITDSAPDDLVVSGDLVVTTGPNGVRATLDRIVSTPGTFTVTLQVCRGDGCSVGAGFGLTVLVPNNPPTATVALSSNTPEVTPTSVLAATAHGSDPDGDAVELSYAWARNGIPVSGATGSTLALTGIASPGDSFTVTVTPYDGKMLGHAGVAGVTLGEALPPPTGPVLTIEAAAGGQPYVEGDWSRVPVTVTFTCTSGVPTGPCPEPVTVDEDTAADGAVVAGSFTDELGRTATAQIVVRVDGTVPVLAPTVTPSQVPVGGAAVAAANATDASSGVASQSCDPPDTSTVGSFELACEATDVAGNTATGTASYAVVAEEPGGPTITAEARSRGEVYEPGSWVDGPVQVRFTCASDVRVTSCSRPVTVAQDTGPDGLLVTGTARDASGRTASVEVLVRVDRTPPTLAPAVVPDPVPVGGTAVASAHATDSGSGVAQESCETPSTAKTGKRFVWCEATDQAGNTAKAKANYTVVMASPASALRALATSVVAVVARSAGWGW